MLRSNRQVQAIIRAARPLADLVMSWEGREWRFWSLAPFRLAGCESVWLTDGVGFLAAAMDRVSGLVSRVEVAPGTMQQLDAAAADWVRHVGGCVVRMADDRLSDVALFVPERSAGCPCVVCAPANERAAALARHAIPVAAA